MGEKENNIMTLIFGIIIGFFLGLFFLWFVNRNEHPEDWCNNLSSSDASYCRDLYWKSVKRQKDFTEKYGDPMDYVDRPME